MRLIALSLLALMIATGVGLGATWMTATRGIEIGTLTIGPWMARPRSGSSEIDPYARATVARSGELPVGTGDGIAFTATADDAKKPLDGRCDVVVKGVTPAARFWTLTLYDTKGKLVANALQRYGFTSQEAGDLVRRGWLATGERYARYGGAGNIAGRRIANRFGNSCHEVPPGGIAKPR